METETQDKISLPLDIELLFDNAVLDTISLLCVISCFEKKKKGIKLDQLAFYYSIATSRTKVKVENMSISVDNSKAKIDVDAWYWQVCSKINYMVGYLAANNLINLFVEPEFNQFEIGSKINKNGLETVKSLKSPYYHELMERVKVQVKDIEYNKRNLLKIMGVNK